LSGAVRTSPEKVLAELAAKRVAGVERVQSEIVVVRPVAF
jgi:osmotically-inducible protein OsmY